MFDDAIKVCEEKFPRERFVFRNRKDIATSSTHNSGRANLAQGSNHINCNKWMTFQEYKARHKTTYASILHNSITVIQETNSNDSNDINRNIDVASEINLKTSIDSKTLDDVESSNNHMNNSNEIDESDWDFMNEELGKLV